MQERLKALLRFLWDGSAPPLSIEEHPYATATTPDDIIAAAVIESFAKDFEEWTLSGELNPYLGRHEDPPEPALKNQKRLLVVRFKLERVPIRHDRYTIPSGYRSWAPDTAIVNGTAINRAASDRILAAWKKLNADFQAAKAAAEKAKRDMEENEKKWNLAEQLMGMRRNEFGALVPANS